MRSKPSTRISGAVSKGSRKKVALSICAHPDDAEFLGIGTMILLKQKGYELHIATMTPGHGGSTRLNREDTAKLRKIEAAKAAEVVGAQYHCLDFDDHFFFYDERSLRRTMELVRRYQPAVVLTHCPQDYIFDHINTGNIAMTATFTCGMPNIEIPGHFEPIPHLYYLDAIEGIDRFGDAIPVDIVVDITSTMRSKERMLACHESQREWMQVHHGEDNYVESAGKWAAARGKLIGRPYAEGFRQHLGHPFPQDDLLKKELGDLVHVLKRRAS